MFQKEFLQVKNTLGSIKIDPLCFDEMFKLLKYIMLLADDFPQFFLFSFFQLPCQAKYVSFLNIFNLPINLVAVIIFDILVFS